MQVWDHGIEVLPPAGPHQGPQQESRHFGGMGVRGMGRLATRDNVTGRMSHVAF